MSTSSSSPRGLPVKEALPLGRVRRVMAQVMRDSVQRAALSQITREMDLSAVQAARQAAGEARHSLNTYLMAAAARTLPNHPLLNAELVDDTVLVYQTVNLGMAIAVTDGLVVAVIRDAHNKSLGELDAVTRDLAARARNGKLTLADIEGGTFTVSNLGMYGVDGGFPLPRPPEGCILLIGRVRSRPELTDGVWTNRNTAWFGLTFDHRFIDGAAAAKFLQEMQDVMVRPETLGT